MPAKSVLYYGSQQELLPPLQLRAGPLTMIFEPASAFLRHVRLGDHEVLRAIYGAVRDGNWATIPPKVCNVQSQIETDNFRLSFDVICRERDIDFLWRGQITGDRDGKVAYTFDGEARSRFQRNRIGLCALHPIVECSGRPCVVKHSDGREEHGTFPRLISPHQPFFDVREISYAIATTGMSAEVQFAGEVFEMEDQRNWTDTSFKTYSTPQSLPKPVTVEPGTNVQHTITLNLRGAVRPVLPVLQGRPPQISISTTPVLALPPIGLCVSSLRQPLTPREVDRLKLLRPSHLRVDLKLSSPEFPILLQEAAAQAALLNTGLHVGLILSDGTEAQLRTLVKEVERVQPRVLLWLLFHEPEPSLQEKWVRLAQPILQSCAPKVLLAGGSREFFTELNRGRPSFDAPFFPAYPITPQVHMQDNTTLVENLAAQVSTVETAKEFSARPVVISPITLRVPTRESSDQLYPNDQLPPDVDPRQMSLFGAGWTLGSITRLAGAGVHSLTYFETKGWKGVMESESGSAVPEKFPSFPGSVFPMFHVLADVAEFAGKQLYLTHSTHPLLVQGLALLDGRRRRFLVANLTGEVQETKIKTGTCKGRVRFLDEGNAEQAMREPEKFRSEPSAAIESVAGKIELKLRPFALAKIDLD